MSEKIKTWVERAGGGMNIYKDAAADGRWRDEEIAELRAALYWETNDPSARNKLWPMPEEDGSVLQWYFDCDGHYIDVIKDENGLYSIFFKDRKTMKDGWLDQAELAP